MDNNGSTLADFNPPENPVSVGSEKKKETDPSLNYELHPDNDTNRKQLTNTNEDEDSPINQDLYNNMSNSHADNYYQNVENEYNSHPATYQTQVSNKDELSQKLNYMIHLLEEQQDERVGHVTEELILYSFLGIFIIFVVDSFARAGKYIR
jgi:hypothetical protein